MAGEDFVCEATETKTMAAAETAATTNARKPRPAKAAAHPTSSGSRGRRPRPAKAAPPTGPASPVTMASLMMLAAGFSHAPAATVAWGSAEPTSMLAYVAVGMEVDA